MPKWIYVAQKLGSRPDCRSFCTASSSAYGTSSGSKYSDVLSLLKSLEYMDSAMIGPSLSPMNLKWDGQHALVVRGNTRPQRTTLSRRRS
jgi:hypothetical protein